MAVQSSFDAESNDKFPRNALPETWKRLLAAGRPIYMFYGLFIFLHGETFKAPLVPIQWSWDFDE